MTTKILYAIIASLLSVLLTIGTWWVVKVNGKLEVVDQLHYRSLYLDGPIKAAPLQPIPKP